MKTLCLAALAALSLGGAAWAQDDDEDKSSHKAENRADVRCILAMAVMRKNPQYENWGGLGMLYFTGRLEGRMPKLNLASAIRREVSQMRPAEYNDEVKRCSDLLTERNTSLRALGAQMQPRGVGR